MINYKSYKSAVKDYQNLLDFPFTLNELQDKIPNQKACGVDGILNEMTKYTDHKLAIL